MKIVNFIGGLGNQLFQYAFYLYMKQYDDNTLIDTSSFEHYHNHNGYELEKVFELHLPHANRKNINTCKDNSRFIFAKIKRKLGIYKPTHIMETNFRQELLIQDKLLYFDGYWQKSQYITPIEQNLKNSLKFRFSLDDYLNKKIIAGSFDKFLIGIHIRRGDYLNKKNLNHFEQCPMSYYTTALDLVIEKHKPSNNIEVLIFSDDMEWVQNHLSINYKTTYIDWNKNDNSYKDLQLMTICNALIISNSTFSWWGGFLNIHKDATICCPSHWFKNKPTEIYIPSNWCILSNK